MPLSCKGPVHLDPVAHFSTAQPKSNGVTISVSLELLGKEQVHELQVAHRGDHRGEPAVLNEFPAILAHVVFEARVHLNLNKL